MNGERRLKDVRLNVESAERPLSSSVVDQHLNFLEEFGYIERVRIRDTMKRVIQLPEARFVAPPVPEVVQSP